MNIPRWAAWIFVAILALISVLVFIGKGATLIAGYNTSSKEEKSKYNVKALGKVVGGGLGVITIIVVLIVFFNGELPSVLSWLNPWGLLGTIVLVIIFGNTICKK